MKKDVDGLILYPLCTDCLNDNHNHDLNDPKSNCKTVGIINGYNGQCGCGMGGHWKSNETFLK